MQCELRLLEIFFPGGICWSPEDWTYHMQKGREIRGACHSPTSWYNRVEYRWVPDAWVPDACAVAFPTEQLLHAGWHRTQGRLKSLIASMFLGDCHTNGRSLQPYPIGSPSDLWKILNLCDVEAKELNFQIRGDSKTSFQSKPQKNFSQKGAGPGRWNQTPLSLTFHRRQSY